MIWLIWRQYRVAMGMGMVVLVALSLVFVMDAHALNAALQAGKKKQIRLLLSKQKLKGGLMLAVEGRIDGSKS